MAENASPQNVPPSPDLELQRLEPLIGKWKSKDHTQDSILGPGVPVINQEEFYWLEGGYFLVLSFSVTTAPIRKKEIDMRAGFKMAS